MKYATPRGVKRIIIHREFYRPTNIPSHAKSSVIVTLECGHQKGYKGSQQPKATAFCSQCPEVER